VTVSPLPATELVFYEDPYVSSFDASVIGVEGNAVALDRTAFYPGGGGQPADSGRLLGERALAVVGVRREGQNIWHELDVAELEVGAPAVGSAVVGELDWGRRYRLMRTHSALHILCGVVWRDYGASVTGGNMEPLRGRMDFEFDTMRQELVREIEEKINEEVARARPITSRILPRDEAFAIQDLVRTKVNLLPAGIAQIRVLEIEGLDLQADGGTHVGNTSEVGRLRVTGYKSKGRANKRIEIALEDD